MEYAERIKTDQAIPKKWKTKLLTINRGLIRAVRKYDEALGILTDEKRSQKKVKKGEIMPERHFVKLLRTKRRVEEVKAFARDLKRILERNEGERDRSLIS